jgi:lycopene beta-cyclase
MQQYDYIIAGGGLAGLSLAFYLNESPTLRHKKILIIDRTDKTENDRTWCFWTDEKTAFEEIVFKQWQQIRFFGQDFQEEMTLSPFFYQMIRGIDFYTFVKNKLRQNPNIEWLFGEVEGILDLFEV